MWHCVLEMWYRYDIDVISMRYLWHACVMRLWWRCATDVMSTLHCLPTTSLSSVGWSYRYMYIYMSIYRPLRSLWEPFLGFRYRISVFIGISISKRNESYATFRDAYADEDQLSGSRNLLEASWGLWEVTGEPLGGLLGASWGPLWALLGPSWAPWEGP